MALRVSLALLLVATAFAQPLAAHGLVPTKTTPLADPDPAGPAGTTASPSTPPVAATLRDPSGVLPGLPWEAAGGLTFSAGGTPWKALLVDGVPVADDAAPAPCVPNSPQPCPVTFWCPSLDGGTSVTDSGNTMTIRTTCPYRIADDADLLGSPQIAVNADDPNSVAFFSLHGGGSTEGPTPRSRDPSPEGLTTVTGLSHTTFTSQDHGRIWYDNPWGTDGFGEHVAGTMDHDGNLYISALWSKRLGDDRFNYVIKVYKEQDGRYTIATYQPSKTFSNRADGNTMSGGDLVFVPAPRIEPVNATANQTGNASAPADQQDIGNSTNGESYGVENSPDDRVMTVWFEQALDWRNSTTGKSSWIDAAWTDTSPKDNWTRLVDDQLIGPCMAASNPVAFNGKAYVACVADAGYSGRSRARIGDIDIWSIDPKTGKTTLEESTGLTGGQPRLASRPDGYMAIASVQVMEEAAVQTQVSFGWYGRHWGEVQGVGSQLHTLMGNHRVKEARVTSMALTEEKNNLFLTYMERVNTEGELPEPNPSALNYDPNQVVEYRKIVAMFSECTSGAMSAYDLQTGVARHPFNDEILGDQTGVFDDLQDGMQFWRDPATGEERVYFAYGDHGVIQFGALVGGASGFPCGISAPPLTLPPPPIPAALSTASPYSMMVGATVGATALAMVTYLLAAKKRTVTFSTAKDKRK
ncbi:MAG: hypothetical protein WC876_08565 [Candidatus Thermoplasmatota archaeon]